MSTYSYGPPPPPPPPTANPQQTYGYQQSPHRSTGSSHGQRGRAGHYAGGRNDYQAAQPAYYDQGRQPYPPQAVAHYRTSEPPAATYHAAPPPQWGVEASRVTHHPAPIVSTNYHPNYAAPAYPPAQYPPQAAYGPPHNYGHPSSGQAASHVAHWPGQGAPQPSYGRRGRGTHDNTGSKHHYAAAPQYEHEYPGPSNGAYPQPYVRESHGTHYAVPAYPYHGPPPPPTALHHHEGYYSQSPRRGRGGHKDSSGRGRGNHHTGDKSRQQKTPHNDGPAKVEAVPAGKKKKRKTNTLGLTPGMESESEDDEEEEKVLTELIGQDTLNITDIAAYLAERKKHYPTKTRVEAKKTAERVTKSEDKASLLEKQADKLRRQLRKVESSIKRKREQGDEGDEMRESSSEESSDAEKPEEVSARPDEAQPPLPYDKRADISRHCKYYSTGGNCGKKGKCRFVHDPEIREAAMKEREANNGRLTLQQRLILNDKEQEDLTILQSIQYLRERGLASSAVPTKSEEPRKDKSSRPARSGPPTSGSSLLPAASASLPPPPIKREPGSSRRHHPPSVIPNGDQSEPQSMKHYQGWLLRPYGSAGGKHSKSDDLP